MIKPCKTKLRYPMSSTPKKLRIYQWVILPSSVSISPLRPPSGPCSPWSLAFGMKNNSRGKRGTKIIRSQNFLNQIHLLKQKRNYMVQPPISQRIRDTAEFQWNFVSDCLGHRKTFQHKKKKHMGKIYRNMLIFSWQRMVPVAQITRSHF